MSRSITTDRPRAVRRSARRVLGLGIVAALGLSACGGGDDSGSGSSASTATAAPATTAAGSVTTTKGSSPASTAPLPTAPKQTLKTTTAMFSFFNGYLLDGKPTAIDIWWVYPSAGGEKAITVPYGTRSNPVALKVLSSKTGPAYSDPSIAIFPAGETDTKRVIQHVTNTARDGEMRIIVVGNTKPLGSVVSMNGGTQNILISGGTSPVATPPAGKALVVANAVPLGHLQPKDFLTPGVGGKCLTLDNNLGGGNAGAGYALDPGTVKLALYDANTSCASPLGAVDTVVAAGDRFLLVGYGETVETRKTAVLKL
jgi:hypothetical protein